MGVTEKLAKFIVETPADAIPAAAIDRDFAFYPTRCRHEDLYPVRRPDGGVKLHWPIWFSLISDSRPVGQVPDNDSSINVSVGRVCPLHGSTTLPPSLGRVE